jgi:hypothetical protein
MRKRPILNGIERLWQKDVTLTSLLVFLLMYIFFLYPLGQVGSFLPLTSGLFSLILISGAITVSRHRVFKTLVFSWGVLAIVFLWVKHLFPYQIFVFVADGLGLFFLILLVFLILGQVLREGETTSQRVMGGVAAYLILGLTWYLAYHLVALGFPGAFSIQGSSLSGDRSFLSSQLFYFSFVTLTTIGYGDIVAVHPLARMLVILEGVTGQLFPVILIARLVSLQVQARRKT